MLAFVMNRSRGERFRPRRTRKLDAPQLMEAEFDLILSAIKFGDLSAFTFALERLFKDDWLQQKEAVIHGIRFPGNNTVLHHAALMKGGATDIVKFVCETAPFIMGEPNAQGDTVWHIAVRDCSCAVFSILYDQRDLVVKKRLGNGDDDSSGGAVMIDGVAGGWEGLSLGAANHYTGNTALHEALLSGNRNAAGKLFVADMDLCYNLNKENKSPLYLAVQLEDAVLFNNMLRYAVTNPGGLEKIAKGKSIVRVAISKKLKGSLNLMWDLEPRLFELVDPNDSATLPFIPEDLRDKHTSTGPFVVNYDALLALENCEMPGPVAPADKTSSVTALKQLALSRSRTLKLLSQRGISSDRTEDMINFLLIFSIPVAVFCFLLTHISSFNFQPLLGASISLMYITCFGVLVLAFARYSGNIKCLTMGILKAYLAIVIALTILVLTNCVHLFLPKLLYVAAVIALVVVLPMFLLKPFVRAFLSNFMKSVKP